MRDGRAVRVVARLSRRDLAERVIRLPPSDHLPAPRTLFDLRCGDATYSATVREEPCDCGRPPRVHRHRYLECAELYAGLRWAGGARIVLDRRGEDWFVDGDFDR